MAFIALQEMSKNETYEDDKHAALLSNSQNRWSDSTEMGQK